MNNPMTLIIGGGLSGLAIAEAFETRGEAYHLIEARTRLGGRIDTVQHAGGAFDMGPAWFWQGQPRIAALLTRLGLNAFEQYAQGALSYEDEHGQVQRGRGFSSMEGSLRVEGGFGAVIDALAGQLDCARVRCGKAVVRLSKDGGQVTATLSDGETVNAERVVLALPPRVAAQIAFDPPLPAGALEAMRAVPTWMAGQAKALAVYDQPFWREDGLSGDAMSRVGPMLELHDASPATGGPYALLGFIGVPPAHRVDTVALRQALLDQLGRVFGPRATEPAQLFVKDWAHEVHTATAADHLPLMHHPTYGMPPALKGLWDGRLLCAGTEVATQFGGYIEGALEAAEAVLD